MAGENEKEGLVCSNLAKLKKVSKTFRATSKLSSDCHMTCKFRRTNKTNLTDNELMLFDASFDSWGDESTLRLDKFAALHNFSFEHTLTNEGLAATLVALKKRGLMKSRKSLYVRKSKNIREMRDFFTLTSAGGRVWSLERNPDWNRYVFHSAYYSDEGSIVQVYCASERTLINYTKAETDYLRENLGVAIEPAYKTLENHYLIPWKRFSKIYLAEWLEPFSLVNEFLWEDPQYARQRTGAWNSINDLIKEID